MAHSIPASLQSAKPDLSRSLTEPRSVRNALLTAGAWAVALIAAVPIGLMGGIVASIVLAIMLPILQLNQLAIG